MSHTYKASLLTDPEMWQETHRLEKALNEPQPDVSYQVRHAAPNRTWAGMSVYADGTDWNPGSGEGIYRRDKTNANWVFVG